MASLTPGTLSKLLQNLNNPSAKVAGDHRSPLLQVIGIVPQHDVFDFPLNNINNNNNNNNNDKNKQGFYLRLSDSLHSAYVSVPEGDIHLILNDEIQLGQFVHLTRLGSGSPVPVVCGIKPVLKRRACVGEPKDLISSDLLVVRGFNGSSNNDNVNNVRNGRNGKKEGSNGRRMSLSGRENGKVEMRRLSLDFSGRKGWERSPVPAVRGRKDGGGVGAKVVEALAPSPRCATPVGSARKSSLVKDPSQKPPTMNLAPLKNKNVIVSEKLISKPIKKDLKTSFDSISLPANLTKVPVNPRTCPDSKISWDFVSPTIRQLGKEAICHRNMGFSSAVHALKETSAMENILQCMSRFAEICELAETFKSPLVEQFLNFYHKLQTSAAEINTLIDSKSTVDETKGQHRNSALWVQAALATNLGKFTLYTTEENRKMKDSEGNYHIVLENASDKVQLENRLPGNKKIPKTQEAVASKVKRSVRSPIPATKNTSPERVKWSKGSGLNETAKLAEELLSVSRKWFLNYLEESLNKGFWFKKGEEDSVVVVGLLGQLKRVNQWLDDSVRGYENVENLRKKIYRFLLDHVQKAAR